MENIGKFLDGCYAYGCVKIDMFQTVDLYEAQNIPQVCMHKNHCPRYIHAYPCNNACMVLLFTPAVYQWN